MAIGWHSRHMCGCDCGCCPGMTRACRDVAGIARRWRAGIVIGNACCRECTVGSPVACFPGQIRCGISSYDLSKILSSKFYNKILDERAFFADCLFTWLVFRRPYCAPSRFGPHLYYLSKYFFNIHLLKCNRNNLRIRSACTD